MVSSLRISKKIWLAVSVLIVGYAFSMVFGYTRGQETEAQLDHVADSLFEAAMSSQVALAAFDEQAKSYEDAFFLGEVDGLDTAKSHVGNNGNALDSILALDDIGAIETTVRDFAKDHTEYSSSADAAYRMAIEAGDEEDGESEAIQNEVVRIGTLKSSLRDRLVTLTETTADDLRSELTGTRDATRDQRILSVWVFFIVVIAAIAFITIIVRKFISRPLERTVAMLDDIAQGDGDLTMRLDVNGEDEIGRLSRSYNDFVEKIQILIQKIAGDTGTLAVSSEALSRTSTDMTSTADAMQSQSAQVKSATGEMSSNLTSVSGSADAMSGVVNTVATAVEEMSASLSEVAKNCAQASSIAADADSKARRTGETMGQLNTSSLEIGKVLDTISDIADQTNLLALNATIEAASAGEAGKGFAVVANEVKELAKQTAVATEEISRQIDEMQSNTGRAVDAIDQIATVIAEVNEITRTIASAVEEQSSTTNEIARSVGDASISATDISSHVKEASSGANEILENVQNLDSAASTTAAGATDTSNGATDLAELADRLRGHVGVFKVS